MSMAQRYASFLRREAKGLQPIKRKATEEAANLLEAQHEEMVQLRKIAEFASDYLMAKRVPLFARRNGGVNALRGVLQGAVDQYQRDGEDT